MDGGDKEKQNLKPNLVGHFGGKFKAGEGSFTVGGEVAAHDRRDDKRKASMYVDSPKKGLLIRPNVNSKEEEH